MMKFIPTHNLSATDTREGALLSTTLDGKVTFLRVKTVSDDSKVAQMSVLARKPRNHKGDVTTIDAARVYDDEAKARMHFDEWMKAKAKEEKAKDGAKSSGSSKAKNPEQDAEVRTATNDEIIRIIVDYVSRCGNLFGAKQRGMKTAFIYLLCARGYRGTDIWHGLHALDTYWDQPGRWSSTKGCVARRRAEFLAQEPKVFKTMARYSII